MRRLQQAAKFKSNPYFEQYLGLLVQLHTAMHEDDEDRADAIRDEMDAPGLHLSPDEVQWVKGVSADLYMLANDESFHPLDRSQAQLMSDLRDASTRGDGETMLLLLRRANFLSAEHRAWFRYQSYNILGYYSLSMLFLAYVVDRNPERFEYKYMLLAKMIRQNDTASAIVLAEEYAKALQIHPMLRVLIAIAFLNLAKGLSKEAATPCLQRAIDVVKVVPSHGLPATDTLMAWMVLGECYYKLGDVGEALVCDNEAVLIAPDNPNVLESRGRHRLRSDYGGAIEDFRAAVNLGTPLPFPYLFLIREELQREAYEHARLMSNRLLAINKNHRVQAQGYELLALALYGLGRPPSEVGRAYGQALRLAPSSQRRLENYQALTAGSAGLVDTPLIHLPSLTIEEIEQVATEIAEDTDDAPSASLATPDSAAKFFTDAKGMSLFEEQVSNSLSREALALAA